MKNLFKFFLKHEFFYPIIVSFLSIIFMLQSGRIARFPLLNEDSKFKIPDYIYKEYGVDYYSDIEHYRPIDTSYGSKEHLDHIFNFLHKPPSQTLIEPCKKVLENIKEKKLSTTTDIMDYIFNSGEVIPTYSDDFNKKTIISDEDDIELLLSWLDCCGKNFRKGYELNYSQTNDLLKKQLKNIRFSQDISRVSYNHISDSLFVIILCLVFNKDRSANMLQLIHSKPNSGARYLLSRYLCQLFYFIILQLICLFGLTIFVCYKSAILGYEYNIFDFISYYFVYNLPTILYDSSIVLLFSVIFKKLVWLILFSYITTGLLSSVIFEKISIFRFFNAKVLNNNYDEFITHNILINKISITILSLIFIFLSCYFWSKNKTKN